jgi:hypothetical protein
LMLLASSRLRCCTVFGVGMAYSSIEHAPTTL